MFSDAVSLHCLFALGFVLTSRLSKARQHVVEHLEWRRQFLPDSAAVLHELFVVEQLLQSLLEIEDPNQESSPSKTQ